MGLSALGRSFVRRTKDYWKATRTRTVRRLLAFDGGDLLVALQRLGVAPGDVLFVHSSLDAFEGFTGDARSVIDALQRAVGDSGTLLMPTQPFRGTAVAYAARGQTFDVRRTASQMGLLTELFRRSPGVTRSVHPTHAVAARGSRAAEFVEDHHRARTPCGRPSPYSRLLDAHGRILLLGTGIEVATFFHCLEEELEPRLPVSPFTSEVFTLTSRDWAGRDVSTETRLFDSAVSKHRNLHRLEPVLRRAGAWRTRRIGGLRLTLVDALEMKDAVLALARRGIYCYDS